MLIGIDASRAFVKQRTGIEEYSYRVIKRLRNELGNKQACLPMRQVVLYIRKNQTVDFVLPENWKVKVINFPYLWTQIGLSLEMLFCPVDILFISAHTVPLIHPKKTIVSVHGLEYEFCPEAYSFWERMYMRWLIKNSCRWAKKIIAVSENTKRDLMRLYKIPESKITVVYEGHCEMQNANLKNPVPTGRQENDNVKFKIDYKYLLFIGRLEKRKNILGIIKAFEILKEKYKILHKLILAGNFGYGEEEIKNRIKKSKYKKDIILTGFIAEEKKWQLLKNADMFLFPSFYEGFGLPILEAQSAGAPVVASSISSLPEVAGGSAFLIDPKNYDEIAEAAYKIISDKNLREEIIKNGFENVKRFSWEKCASEVARILEGV